MLNTYLLLFTQISTMPDTQYIINELEFKPFFFFFFVWMPHWHMKIPGQGSDLSCSWDVSCSYGNVRSLTHCAGPGWNLHLSTFKTPPILLSHSSNSKFTPFLSFAYFVSVQALWIHLEFSMWHLFVWFDIKVPWETHDKFKENSQFH